MLVHRPVLAETACICSDFPYPEDDDTGSYGRPVPGVGSKLVYVQDPKQEI